MSSNEGAPLGTGAGDPDSDDVGANKALHEMIAAGGSFSGRERNCAFLNTRDGAFADMSFGSGFGLGDDARALLPVDWDQDGDLDLFVTNRGAPMLRFLRNDAGQGQGWIALRLEGVASNRDAIGARVELLGAHGPQSRTVSAGYGFLAQGTRWLHFGLGDQAGPVNLRVHWPSGAVQDLAGVEAGQRYRLLEGGTPVALPPREAISLDGDPDPGLPAQDSGRVFLSSALPLPPIACSSMDGAPEAIQDHGRGRPLVVNLWGTSCSPCLKEIGEWWKQRAELEAAGLAVLLLSTDGVGSEGGGGAQGARKMLARLGVQFDGAMASEAGLDTLQVLMGQLFARDVQLALPTTLLLDANGDLAVIYRGTVHAETLIQDAENLGADARTRRDLSVPFSGQWIQPLRARQFSTLVRALADAGFVDDAGAYVARHAQRLEGERAAYRVLADLGNRYYAQGDPLRAASLYRQAIAERPEFAKAHFNLGVALEALLDPAGAQASYRAALQRRAGYARARINLAGLFEAQGDVDAAVAELEQVAAENAEHAEARARLSNLRGDRSAAKADLEAALHADAAHRGAQLSMAWLCATAQDEALRDGARALALAEAVIAADGGTGPVTLDVLAAARAASGDFPGAVTSAQEAFDLAVDLGGEEFASQVRTRLDAYRAGRAWSE